MSEPLYRIDLSPIEEWLQGAVMRELQHRIDSGVLVPVEPCEHGKIDKHPTSGKDRQGDWTYWCPGAGIGGDE